jgi:hypothetical protein
MRRTPILVGLAVALQVPFALAQDSAPVDDAVLRLGGMLGVDLWPDLGDLDPVLRGDFDEAGFAGELSLHGGGWKLGAARIFLGADAGFMGHDSDVEGIDEREDLQTSVRFVTPSVKALFGPGDGVRWSLDAGLGYYDVSIDEFEDDCWSCDVDGYYDDGSFGGYLGVTVEFPVTAGDHPLWLTAGAKVHSFDLDEPDRLDPGGDLDGPIWMLGLGLAFYPW